MANRNRKRRKAQGRKQSPRPYVDPSVKAPPVPQKRPIQPDVSEGFSSIVQTAFNILVNPDLAVRTDNRLQEQMIRDPMIMAPLQRRQLATAQLEWQILPEDEEDPRQIEVAEFTDDIIRNIPNLMDLFRDLQWGTFRGTGVSEVNWDQRRKDNAWVVTTHRSHHGDKFLYTKFGDVRLRTRDKQQQGRELTKGEKDRLIIHTVDRDDGEFFEGAEAGYIFKGRGLRDLMWQYWWLKHNALKFWLTFLEHKGTGYLVGTYPMGNTEAKQAIESTLRNLTQDSKVSLPVPTSVDGGSPYGIENVADSDRSGVSGMFLQFVDDFVGKKIRLLIEGQDQTSQDSGDGLGSGRAEALTDVFTMIRNYDAQILSQTLTDTLLSRLVFFNFGDVPFKLKFAFITEDKAEEAKLRLDAAKEAGLAVPKVWAYDSLGIPIPQKGDEVIDFGASQAPDLGVGGSPFSFSEPESRAARVYDSPAHRRYREALS